jgi:inhibitor of KinA sporulation pathway (predicted exonuclease)
MAELSKGQKKTMKKHSKHHTSRHMRLMKGLMEKGMSFTKAHKKAIEDVGK